MKDAGPSNALPNSFGKVRTFKDDLQNFGKEPPANDIPEPKNISPPEAEKASRENTFQKQTPPQSAPAAENVPSNPFQSVPTPPPLSSAGQSLPAFKSSPSQSFFAENPTPADNASPNNQENVPASPKAKSKVLPIIILILALTVACGGFYYYWFYIKSSPAETSQSPVNQPATAPASTPGSSASSSSAPATQNNNLRQLVVDTSQSPTEIKNALQKFSTEFATTALEGDLVEIKLLKKDNQLIGKKDFFSGFGATIPESILMKLSEDYSVFARKEGDTVKLGLVFKTVTTSGLTNEMEAWEPLIINDLLSLFAGQTPTGSATFDSSRYKSADIRYSNFSSPTGFSIDYSVISNFLVIGTSKESARAILDYMSEK